MGRDWGGVALGLPGELSASDGQAAGTAGALVPPSLVSAGRKFRLGRTGSPCGRQGKAAGLGGTVGAGGRIVPGSKWTGKICGSVQRDAGRCQSALCIAAAGTVRCCAAADGLSAGAHAPSASALVDSAGTELVRRLVLAGAGDGAGGQC